MEQGEGPRVGRERGPGKTESPSLGGSERGGGRRAAETTVRTGGRAAGPYLASVGLGQPEPAGRRLLSGRKVEMANP